jgi:hypothetical protein
MIGHVDQLSFESPWLANIIGIEPSNELSTTEADTSV